MANIPTWIEHLQCSSGSCFPYGFRSELKALFHLAWPTSFSILFHQLIQPISLMFCGHLGNLELASVAMALSVIYIVCVSIARGLAFGGDTFFSQTYGSANKMKVGIYLQKALVFSVLISCVICAVLLNTETLLLLLYQDPAIAKMTQKYCNLFTPGVLAYCWLFTLMRYLLCQNRVIPNLLVCMVSCGINAALNYGLIYQAGMGIEGSAIALALTYYLSVFLLVAYIWGSGIYTDTWGGWSFECLEEWGAFAKVVSSSIFMTFLFWLCTECGTFLAGLLGEEYISAFSILFQVEGFAWMVPMGLGGACTARIGQYLGANKPLGAITACRVTLLVQVVISVAMGGATYGLRYYIPMAFTSDSGLIDYTASLMPILAIFILLEGTGGIGMSIINGTGRHTLGAIILFISYYVLALPIGIPLMFATFLAQAGLWWGFVLGLASEDVSIFIFVNKLDWDDEASKAQVRAGVVHVNGSLNGDQSGARHGVQQDSTETTGHLSGQQTSTSLPTDVESPSRTQVVIRRVFTAVIFLAILAAGIAIRVYVHIEKTRSRPILCRPQNTTWSENRNQIMPNVTLPICNETRVYPGPGFSKKLKSASVLKFVRGSA